MINDMVTYSERSSASVARKTKPLSTTTKTGSWSENDTIGRKKRLSFGAKDMTMVEGLMPKAPTSGMEVDHHHVLEAYMIPSRLDRPAITYKALEPFDHPGPRTTDCFDIQLEESEFQFDPDACSTICDTGTNFKFDFNEFKIIENSLLFSIDHQASMATVQPFVTPMCTENPLIDVGHVPQNLRSVLSRTTFQYNHVMGSVVFNINMGAPPITDEAFEYWLQSINNTLHKHTRIVDVLISVKDDSASATKGAEADKIYLSILWLISLLGRMPAKVHGLSLVIPPHLSVSQEALNMAPCYTSPRDPELDIVALSYSGSLSLLNNIIPISSMNNLESLVINDPQVSIDDVVILLKQAPKLYILDVDTLADCDPALLPMYQMVCSRSASPAPPLDQEQDGDERLVVAGAGSGAKPSTTVSCSTTDSQYLSVGHGNVPSPPKKATEYPYLETLVLKYNAGVRPEKLLQNISAKRLRRPLLIRRDPEEEEESRPASD